MLRFAAVVAVVLVGALACAALAQAPAGPPRGERMPGARGYMGGAANPDQMIERLAQQIGLTKAETAAVKTAARDKLAARQALGEKLQALRDVAQKPNASEQELRAALDKYNAALTAYRAKIKSIDERLVKQVSLKARVRLTAAGVIDNGLGPGFGARMGPGGGGLRARRAVR